MKKFEDIKQKVKNNKIVEYFSGFSKKKKIIIGGVAGGIIVLSIVLVAFLYSKEYVPLFTEVSSEEATQIVAKLQEDGVDYQYNGDGTIMVEESVADQTRANLVYEGYPKSGFSYDIYINNAGGMTTDSERETYELYELQDRIGATIGLFDGVEDAKVNIALAEKQKYALEGSGEDQQSSASVVVTMKDGSSPPAEMAAAIQRLVAKSVQGMELSEVAVFDGNGLEVSVDDGDKTASADDAEEIAKIIETQMSNKVINVLGPFYGPENIRVSARGQVNMERVIRESVTYETPEKIDEEDKEGIVGSEESSVDIAGTGEGTAGAAGTTSNSEIPQYSEVAGDLEDGYYSSTIAKEYLVNQIKEQGEIDPGSLEDLTVAVSINGDLGELTEGEIKSLVGNATGIATEDVDENVTVVAAPFYSDEEEELSSNLTTMIKDYWMFGVIGLVILLILITALALIMRKRRKNVNEELIEDEELGEDFHFFEELEAQRLKEEQEREKEMMSMRSEKSKILRDTIRGFADENPEISAQMIKMWLNGGNEDGGKSDQNK